MLRIFVDTSVFGGCFDDEFKEFSLKFFDQAKTGHFKLIISQTVLAELSLAPQNVQEVLTSIPTEWVEIVDIDDEIILLRNAYLEAKILGPASLNDAEHIAAATVSRSDIIISWNFKHVVNYGKIKGYQGINLIHGYYAISIYSPREVIGYE